MGWRAWRLVPDGQTFASGSIDLTIRLWDSNTGKEMKRIDVPNIIYQHVSVAGRSSSIDGYYVSPEGRILEVEPRVGITKEQLRLPKLPKPKFKPSEGQQTGPVRSIAFGRNHNLLASASRSSIYLWDTTSRGFFGKVRPFRELLSGGSIIGSTRYFLAETVAMWLL